MEPEGFSDWLQAQKNEKVPSPSEGLENWKDGIAINGEGKYAV